MAAASPEYQMNNQRTWPCKSDNGPRFTSFSFQSTKQTTINKPRTNNPTINKPRTSNPTINKPRTNNPTINNHNFQLNPKNQDLSDFSQLPDDVLLKIAATFTLPNLRAASQVCKSWCDGLRPLREAMLFLKYGKRFKHGRGGVKVNLNKALESFLKGAARGSTLAMVDAGLVYWEMGRKEQGISFYRKAAVLGDPAGQCNLGICLLQANPPDSEEAIKWLYKASVAGYVRAQYQLALCLHKGRGPSRNLQEAARWYLKAAEGGYIRAMYNIAMCYSVGEGLVQSHKLARKWMKRAADRGHSKAQFEHGLSLFSEGNMTKAVVYLELATRAGETAADHVKYVILQEMSNTSCDRAMLLADNWRPLPSASR